MFQNLELIKAGLAEIGWPTNLLVVDFETFFSDTYTLSKMTTAEFVRDKRFEILGLAYWHEPMDQPAFVRDLPQDMDLSQDHVIVGHNLMFDGMVLKEQYGWRIPYAIDTISLSRYIEARARHSLDEVIQRFGFTDLEEKGDRLSVAKGKRWQELDAKDRDTVAEYANDDLRKTIRLLDQLLPEMANWEVELPFMVNTLHRYWSPQLELDFEAADRLYQAMELEMMKPINEAASLCPQN